MTDYTDEQMQYLTDMDNRLFENYRKPQQMIMTLATAIEFGLDVKKITDAGFEMPDMNDLIQFDADGTWELVDV